MVTTTQPLLTLLARDVMTHTVVTIPQDMPLQAAAQLLSREQITGAPVVDSQGRCTGVISAMDFVHWAQNGGKSEPTKCRVPASICSDWQMVDMEVLPREEVRRHMSADLVAVDPETPITELARRMVDAHIHRVIVVDGQHRPIGIVSSTDILAAVAYAAAETHE